MKIYTILILSVSIFFFGCPGQEISETPTENTVQKAESGESTSAANEETNQSDSEDKAEETSENTGEKSFANNNPAGIETIYTDMDEKKCKTVKSSEEEAWVIQECPGVGGYKLEVIEGDLRQSINVVAPSGGKYQLDFQSNVSMAFSFLGKKAEWRVKKENGKITPVGLITRLNVQEDPNDDKKITSYLVVTKFDGEFICVTDVVKPIKNANVKARQLADAAAKKPCLKGNS
jgi:hypothetical protein